MGRRKIQIKPLPESQIKAKFKKRKLGLVKKAYELGTLCEAQVALIIFSKDGEEVIDKGYNGTPVEIIQRYWREVLGLPQQQIPALQVQQLQFQPNSESSTIDPCMQQEVAVDPNMQQEQYMNPQVQQEQFTNPQVQQDQFMNSQVQQDQFTNPQVQQDQFMNPQVQQEQFMNSQVQQEQFMNPQVQQEQYMNPQVQYGVPIHPNFQQPPYVNRHRQQEVSTGPCMQQDLCVNPHRQQSRTGISQMQQGMQCTVGTNFVGTSSYMQDMAEGNQQFHAQGHPIQFENQTNVRCKNCQPSEPGFRN